MNGLEALKPVSGQHAIKEAVISIFLAGPIFKPERFQKLITEGFAEKFQKAETVNAFEMKFPSDQEQLEHAPAKIKNDVGFRFTRFEDGKQSLVLQSLNESNRYYISLHTLKYERWGDFLDQFNYCFDVLKPYLVNTFIIGFGLNYIDEFNWESETKMPIEDIFNYESDILPRRFFEKQDSHLILTSTDNKNGNIYFDRIELRINQNNQPNISLSHNVVEQLSTTEELTTILESGELSNLLQKAHEDNKLVVKSVLKADIARKIGL